MSKVLSLSSAILIAFSFSAVSQASSLLVSYSTATGGGVEMFSLVPQSAGSLYASADAPINTITTAGNSAYWATSTQIYADSLDDATGGTAKTALPSIPFAGITVNDLAVSPSTNSYLVGWIAPGYGWFIGQYPLSPADGAYSVFVNAANPIQGLTIADGKVYWIEDVRVLSQNLDGTGKAQIQQLGAGVVLNDLAVDPASQTYFLAASAPPLPPLIARYPLSPNASGNLITFGTTSIKALTIADDRAYWIDGSSVWSERLNGTDVVLQETLPAQYTLTDLAIAVNAPEPGTWAMLGGGLVLLGLGKLRRRA